MINFWPLSAFVYRSLSVALVILACLGCFRTDPNPPPVAGNGSEVENAVVVGRVVLANGESVAGVHVWLYPDTFNAESDLPLDVKYSAITDSTGRYEIKGNPGRANLWGYGPDGSNRFFIQGLVLDSARKMDAGDVFLKEPGRIRVIPPDGSLDHGYFFIPGSPVAMNIAGATDSNGAMVLDSIPIGRIQNLGFGQSNTPGSVRYVAHDIVVSSGSTTDIPFTDWTYSNTVSIQLAGKLTLSGPVVDIPLKLELNKTNFNFDQARADGLDLRITKENGRILPCQIQEWDSLQGRARLWVKVDTVFANAPGQKLVLHWGNPRAPAGDTLVFDTADGYVGAWHVDRKPSGFPLVFSDASNANNPANVVGSPNQVDSLAAPGPMDGYLGGGVPLNGKSDFIFGFRYFPGPAEFTVSLWIRTTTREGGKILGFLMTSLPPAAPGSTENYNFDRVISMDDDGLVRAGFTMRSQTYPSQLGYWQSFTAATPLNDGKWHHLSYTLWDSGAMLMVDGLRASGYNGLVKALPNLGQWGVGYCGEGKWPPYWTSEYFQGSVDEVRFMHRSHSDDWLRLDYESQKAGSTLLSVDAHP